MNVDGIPPNKGSDQSLWPILFVINEINRKKTILATESNNRRNVAWAIEAVTYPNVFTV